MFELIQVEWSPISASRLSASFPRPRLQNPARFPPPRFFIPAVTTSANLGRNSNQNQENKRGIVGEGPVANSLCVSEPNTKTAIM